MTDNDLTAQLLDFAFRVVVQVAGNLLGICVVVAAVSIAFAKSKPKENTK